MPQQTHKFALPKAVYFALFGLLFLVFIALVSLTLFRPSPSCAFPDQLGERLGGGAYCISELDGRYLLISFWASWCAPCREELPELHSLYERHRSQGKPYNLVALNVHDDFTKALTFIAELNLDLLYVFDNEGKMAAHFEVGGIPENILFSLSEKRIIKRWKGKSGFVKMKDELETFNFDGG